MDYDGLIEQDLRRVRQERGAFDRIARGARVKKVLLGQLQMRVQRNWKKMVEAKPGPQAAPLLSKETVDTSKTELVAEPGTKTVHLGVPGWPMSTAVRLCRIHERAHGPF